MSNELNATCDICGKKYHVCRSCREIKTFQPWRTVTDTFNHYTIFLVLSEYTKTKNKDIAKKELEKCDLHDLNTFNDSIKNVIKEIMSVDKEKVETPKAQQNYMKKEKTSFDKGVTKNDIE